MNQQEFNDKVGKVLGIKAGLVQFVVINMRRDNHLDLRVSLGVIPNKYQSKSLRELAYEFGNLKSPDR